MDISLFSFEHVYMWGIWMVVFRVILESAEEILISVSLERYSKSGSEGHVPQWGHTLPSA